MIPNYSVLYHTYTIYKTINISADKCANSYHGNWTMIGVIKVPCILVEDLPLPDSCVDSLESLLGEQSVLKL